MSWPPSFSSTSSTGSRPLVYEVDLCRVSHLSSDDRRRRTATKARWSSDPPCSEHMPRPDHDSSSSRRPGRSTSPPEPDLRPADRHRYPLGTRTSPVQRLTGHAATSSRAALLNYAPRSLHDTGCPRPDWRGTRAPLSSSSRSCPLLDSLQTFAGSPKWPQTCRPCTPRELKRPARCRATSSQGIGPLETARHTSASRPP